jgi:KTSC domain
MPSTVIKSFEYDAAKRELLVVFRSGRRYVYFDVPDERFLAMKSAFSKGDYFNTHIRENYKFIRMPDDE